MRGKPPISPNSTRWYNTINHYQLVADIVRMVQPLVAEPVDDDDDEDDEDDEELIADAMDVLEKTPDEDWLDWKEVKAELMRAEAAGELPD